MHATTHAAIPHVTYAGNARPSRAKRVTSAPSSNSGIAKLPSSAQKYPSDADIGASRSGVTHRSPAVLAAAPLFIAELADNPKLATHFRETLMAAELACVNELLDRAVARRELAERPDPAHVHSLILGSVFAWLFMLRRDPNPDLADELADLIVHGLPSSRP